MRSQNVRLNVVLPKDVVDSLDDIAGPRNRSRVISESIREYITQKKKRSWRSSWRRDTAPR